MIKAIFYKEWLKIRWAFIALVLASIFAIIYIWLDVRQSFEMSGALRNWLQVVLRKNMYYSAFRYIPAVSGIVIGIFQFVPEVSKKRLRLAFHLPVDERKSLFLMELVGITANLIVYLLLAIGLLGFSRMYFPAEIVNSTFITILPWILAGFVGYMATAMIALEPSLLLRIVYAVVSYGFMQLLYAGTFLNQFQHSIGKYGIVTAIYLLTVLFPGYRFRRGAK